ncbi:MAG: SUMF1/EgtB/PvdO family nonheme iron enzyme [Elusimicrobiota bacterium]
MTLRLLLLVALLPAGLSAAGAPDMARVPAGEFIMGADHRNEDERPRRTASLPEFYIDKIEVTNAAYAEFVRDSAGYETLGGPWFRHSAQGSADLIAHYEKRYGVTLKAFQEDDVYAREEVIARWRAASFALFDMLNYDGLEPIDQLRARAEFKELAAQQSRLPVRNVTWADAEAFCRRAGKRLPTEAEWEKAARGADGRTFPWGEDWRPGLSRSGLKREAGPVPVGSLPGGASPYGCLDMAGNVWEWVADWYSMPGWERADRLRSPLQGREPDTRKVIRGGAWSGVIPYVAQYNARTSRRLWSNPDYAHLDVGFRCARGAGEGKDGK